MSMLSGYWRHAGMQHFSSKYLISMITSLVVLIILLVGCASNTKPRYDEVAVTTEQYKISSRRHGADPVYSRFVWSALPKPVGEKQSSEAPFMFPSFTFELPDSTLGESISALGQALGYGWDVPKQFVKRKVSINMNGNVEEIIQEIVRQTQVEVEVDYKGKVIRVLSPEVQPRL